MFADVSALTSINTIILFVVALIALVLGALNVRNKYASGQDSQTIKSLKESNATFATRRESDQLVIDSLQREKSAQEEKAKVLENQVTQAPDINKLILQLGKQHKEMMSAMSNMTEQLGNVAKAVVKDSHASK